MLQCTWNAGAIKIAVSLSRFYCMALNYNPQTCLGCIIEYKKIL